MEEMANPATIYHFNRFKSATVQAGLAPGKTIGDGIEEMRKIADKVLDESFEHFIERCFKRFCRKLFQYFICIYTCISLIFLVLAAQFESFIDPFIIMITVPLALAGAVSKFVIIRPNDQYIFTDRYDHADRSCDQEWNFDC